MELLTEQGCILVFDGVVKFFRYFLSFVQCTPSLHILSEIIGCILLKYSKKLGLALKNRTSYIIL